MSEHRYRRAPRLLPLVYDPRGEPDDDYFENPPLDPFLADLSRDQAPRIYNSIGEFEKAYPDYRLAFASYDWASHLIPVLWSHDALVVVKVPPDDYTDRYYFAYGTPQFAYRVIAALNVMRHTWDPKVVDDPVGYASDMMALLLENPDIQDGVSAIFEMAPSTLYEDLFIYAERELVQSISAAVVSYLEQMMMVSFVE